MVSKDIRRIIDEITANAKVISIGAESTLLLGDISGIRVVLKLRRKKPYMDPVLSSSLARERTSKEAKIMVMARSRGIPAPRVYMVLPSIGLIIMEYIEGLSLKDALNMNEIDPVVAGLETGKIIGLLHKSGIVHGDPTTTNFIKYNNNLYLIDYGLSDFSSKREDRAVDIHLFRRVVEASHTSISTILLESFFEGYRSVMGREAKAIIERASEIALMGRYVEERRTVWGV